MPLKRRAGRAASRGEKQPLLDMDWKVFVVDKKKYRWVICAGCTLLFFCTAGLGMTGFSVYQPYFISIGGLTNAQTSMLASVRSMFTFLTLFVAAKVLDRTDIRVGGTLAVIGIAGSMFLYGIADQYPLYVLAAAVAGVCYGIGGMLTVSVMIHRWFEDHQGLAVGICSAGSGFSAVIGTPVIAWMIETYSMRQAFFMEAGFVAISAVIVFLLLRNRPKGEEAPPQFSQERRGKSRGERMFVVGQRGEIFVMAGVLLMGFTYAATSHISVLYKNSGYPTGQISLLVSIMGASLFVGKCLYGAAADKIGSYRSGNLFFGMMVAGCALCCIAGNRSLFWAVFAVTLLCGGSVLLSVGLTVIANTVAKPEYYAVVVRRIQTIYLLGSMVFGVVPSR